MPNVILLVAIVMQVFSTMAKRHKEKWCVIREFSSRWCKSIATRRSLGNEVRKENEGNPYIDVILNGGTWN